MVTEIRQSDSRMMKKVEALLEAEGITRDKHLDYTCGILDDDYNVIATGSAFGNTLRCFAVSKAHQGEGLLNEVISHLMDYQAQRGNFHLFLYTKPQSAKFFGDLGFAEIARVDDALVFMENRKNGFPGYLAELAKTRREGQSAAIVMNANPFTLGHRYLVETAAGENDTLHLFILSEDAGPIPAAVRKRLVMEGVADLGNVVCHDTGPYLISKATFPGYFLKSEESVLSAQARLDTRIFARIAAALGVTRRYVGEEKASLVTGIYNDIMAAELPRHGVECRIIPRKTADGAAPISASTVRKAIQDGKLDALAGLVPETTLRYFLSDEAAPVVAAIRREKDVIHY